MLWACGSLQGLAKSDDSLSQHHLETLPDTISRYNPTDNLREGSKGGQNMLSDIFEALVAAVYIDKVSTETARA